MLTEERVASIYAQCEAAMVMAIDKVRKAGHPLGMYVLVVADTSHRATWLMVRDICGKEPGDQHGFVGLVTTSVVGPVLRKCKADEWADFLETPLADGYMRVLLSADGQVIVSDLPAFPPLPATGLA